MENEPEKFHDAEKNLTNEPANAEDPSIETSQPTSKDESNPGEKSTPESEEAKNEKPQDKDKNNESQNKDKNNESQNKDKNKEPQNKDKSKEPQNKDSAEVDDVVSQPSGEDLSPADIEQIIDSMLNILQECQKKVDDQKIDSHSLVFMLLRIKESLDTYSLDYLRKINSFLVHSEEITAEHYSHINTILPMYGDYVKAIEEEKNDKVDVGPGGLVKKEDLLKLVTAVTDNMYASGMFVKSDRTVIRDVNNCLPERKDIVYKMAGPLPKWLEFQDKVTTQLEHIREQTFKISTYIDFLKQGESKMAPTLDLTALSQTKNLGSNNTRNTNKSETDHK